MELHSSLPKAVDCWEEEGFWAALANNNNSLLVVEACWGEACWVVGKQEEVC